MAIASPGLNLFLACVILGGLLLGILLVVARAARKRHGLAPEDMKTRTGLSRADKSTPILVALITAAGVVIAATIAVLPQFLRKEPEPARVESRGNITGGSASAVTNSPGAQVVNGSTVHGDVVQNPKPGTRSPAQIIQDEITSLRADKARYVAMAQKERLAAANLPKDEAERAMLIASEYDRHAAKIAAMIEELEGHAKTLDAAK